MVKPLLRLKVTESPPGASGIPSFYLRVWGPYCPVWFGP